MKPRVAILTGEKGNAKSKPLLGKEERSAESYPNSNSICSDVALQY